MPYQKAKFLKNRKEEQAFKTDNSTLIAARKRSKRSKGELAICKFLGENHVTFYEEFFFKDFKLLNGRKALFFDFYIPKYNLCIEYDGEQHYTKVFNGQKLPNQERNDFYKNAFCHSKGINLLRIKYTDFDNIEDIICNKLDAISPNC